MNLLNCKTYRINTNKYQYYIIYDYAAGKRNRYTTIVISECEPIIIGRELTVSHSKKVIQKFDQTHSPDWMQS